MFGNLKTFILELTLPFKEIKHFHPEGKSMPNGICYQKGHYCNVCFENEKKFQIYDEKGNNIEPACCKGSIIVFPAHRVITFTNRKYYCGYFFDGSYIGADEESYDRSSMCMYLDDKPLKQVLRYAMSIAMEHSIHHVIVKDLATNKIFWGRI